MSGQGSGVSGQGGGVSIVSVGCVWSGGGVSGRGVVCLARGGGLTKSPLKADQEADPPPPCEQNDRRNARSVTKR